jgi:hypothetical protein
MDTLEVIKQLDTVGDVEAFIRGRTGMSRSEAKRATTHLFAVARREVAAERATRSKILQALLKRNEAMR